MKIYYDTEFLEDGRTIDLISIGMCTEDGRSYYAVSTDLPLRRIRRHTWLMENVVPGLPQVSGDARNRHAAGDALDLLDWGSPDIKRTRFIRDEVRRFIADTPDPELWAYYAAYDHVVLAQLYGPMSDLPTEIPMWTNDLQQEARRLGVTELPAQTDGHHNALADARHNMAVGRYLEQVANR